MCGSMMIAGVYVCVGLSCVVVWRMWSGVNGSVDAHAVGVWVCVCLQTVVLPVGVCEVRCVWCVVWCVSA